MSNQIHMDNQYLQFKLNPQDRTLVDNYDIPRPWWPYIPATTHDTAGFGRLECRPRAWAVSPPTAESSPNPFLCQTEPARSFNRSGRVWRPNRVNGEEAWLSCSAENGKEVHWLFQPISKPLRRTKIILLGYARLKTLVPKREGGGGQREGGRLVSRDPAVDTTKPLEL